MAYVVTDWASRYETHESRKLKRLAWVPVPNQHDGLSFRRIVAHKKGAEIFGAWCLILQVASKMPTRGVLSNETGDLDATDLSVMTGFPAALFELALDVLSSPKIGWIHQSAGTPGESAGTPGNDPEKIPERPRDLRDTGNGKKGKEQKESLSPPTPSRVSGIIALYPTNRMMRGERERISWREGDKRTLERLLVERPDYPFEFAIREEAKKTSIRDPRNFLADLPAVESLEPAMRAEFRRVVEECATFGRSLPEEAGFVQLHQWAKKQTGYTEFMEQKLGAVA